ncbi:MULTISPECIES: hypothetical protein [unclassified Devosia]|uniref:hypothetical protein n=1 Tax=unclassified Devosia TaxID=196773 RepID=UPI0008692153|nr:MULTISPECIES: hypothetical protein [unclassified Devosia]MBN9362894.1 hypothetical protein [Devosia sp.]ODS88445.1 MAG: hypothetical protein ABS47_09990 [Devosia sp. SCN 66-27]OJX23580.1 MAG: hypothetical protein BGO83_01550 [Devosia sp. 66-14]
MASFCGLRTTRDQFVGALVATVLAFIPTSFTLAADEAIFAPGEPVVTGFSGVVPPAAPPVSGKALDYTFIDPAGSSMVIQQLQPDGPPTGQLIAAKPVFSASAADVGQTFGVALDDAPEFSGAAAPNIYLAATSAFGLNIVVPDADGKPVRSKRGAPGATFMPGQWGGAGGAEGYPGSIWKVDGSTGEISLFTTIAANSGAGLGNLVYDPASAQFFVSDLDTGLIYRLAADGIIIDTFDHGVAGRPTHGLAPVADDGSEMAVTDPAFNSEDPQTWGFTQPERKVYGLAVNGGRLFYAVGQAVWSVRINADGSFGTARWELDITGLPSNSEIASIAFDPQGRMILAQRGPQAGSYDYSVFAEARRSSVVRYEREFPDDPATPGTWVETPDSYAIGMAPDGLGAAGGIALGPDFDTETGTFSGACDAYLWSTGDALRDNGNVDAPLAGPTQVHGLQGNSRALVRPQNDPPTLSFFADYDGNTADDQAAAEGHVGAVAIWQRCENAPESYVPPPVLPPPGYVPPSFGPPHEETGEPGAYGNLTLEKWAKPFFCADAGADWLCHFTIRVENTGMVPYWGPVVIDDHLPAGNPGASMSFWPQPPWSCASTGPTAYQCVAGPVLLYPGDGVVLHEVVTLPKALVNYCSIANVAGLNWGWGGDADPSDDFGVGIAGIKAPGCVPAAGTDLLLDKIAAPNCVDAGANWNCSYGVLVQNAGPGNFSGPISVTDTLGVNAPATVVGPWGCVQAGPVLTCNILAPPVNVPPGWASGFVVTAHVPKNVGPPLCDLDNKANINAPAAGSPMNQVAGNDHDAVTDHIPDPACLVAQPQTDLEMQKTALGCSPYFYGVNGYLCKWQMTLTNLGPDPYAGPLSFVDNSAGVTANELTFLYPFCTGTAVVTCTLPGVGLAPGVPVAIPFHTFIPDGPAVCSVTNNLSILVPNPGSPQNPAGNDSATVGQALPNPACFAPGAPKLNIQKTATGCASDPASSDWLCDFDITVFNYGGGAQPGPIEVKDFNDKPTTFSGAACVPSGVDQWLCTRPAALNALDSWTFQATSHVNPNSVTLADCSVVNTVLITNPASGDPGYLAQASQKVPQLFINLGPGPVAVYCDPPSLKLEKSAVTTVKAGDGYDATFTVRATSTGPDPYIGTVELEELLPDGTSFVSSNWACVPTTGNDMHCSSPSKTIPVGKYTQMTIVIHIPADVATKASCNVVNTVTAAISAEVLHSAEGVQYTASAAAQLPAELCRPQSTPVPQQCPTQQVKPDGSCCEAGLQWNGKQCAKPRPVVPKCPADSHLTDNGACVCDKGSHGDPGQCVPNQSRPSCDFRDSRLINGECVCQPGTHGNPGQCRPDVVQPPSCPDDSRLRRGECVCLQGTHGQPGNCRPDVVQPPSCPDDSRLRRGECVCLPNTHGTPGNCRPDVAQPPSCPDDSRLRGGQCVCLPNTHGTPGKCRPDVVEQPSCPDDSRLRGGACVCLPNTHGTPGNCRPDVVEQPSCPDDSRLRGGACVCRPPLQGVPGQCAPPAVTELPGCPDDSHFDKRRNACVCNRGLQGEPGRCTAPTLDLQPLRPGLKVPSIN